MASIDQDKNGLLDIYELDTLMQFFINKYEDHWQKQLTKEENDDMKLKMFDEMDYDKSG